MIKLNQTTHESVMEKFQLMVLFVPKILVLLYVYLFLLTGFTLYTNGRAGSQRAICSRLWFM